jgi:hypothetical protein
MFTSTGQVSTAVNSITPAQREALSPEQKRKDEELFNKYRSLGRTASVKIPSK